MKENDYTTVKVDIVLKQPKQVYFSVENKHTWKENNCTLSEDKNDWHIAPEIVKNSLNNPYVKFYTEDGIEIPRDLIDHFIVKSDDSYSSTEEQLIQIAKEDTGNYIINKNDELLNY